MRTESDQPIRVRVMLRIISPVRKLPDLQPDPFGKAEGGRTQRKGPQPEQEGPVAR